MHLNAPPDMFHLATTVWAEAPSRNSSKTMMLMNYGDDNEEEDDDEDHTDDDDDDDDDDGFDSQDHLVHPCLFLGCFVWVVLYVQGMNKGTLRAFLAWCFYHDFSRGMGASGRSGGNSGRTWFFTSHLFPEILAGSRKKELSGPRCRQ